MKLLKTLTNRLRLNQIENLSQKFKLKRHKRSKNPLKFQNRLYKKGRANNKRRKRKRKNADYLLFNESFSI